MKAADLSSERKVLSSILQGKLDFSNLFNLLTEEVFTTEKTRIIYLVLKDYFLENSELPTLSITKRKIRKKLKQIDKKHKEKGYTIFLNKLLKMKKQKQTHLEFFVSELFGFWKTRMQFDLIETASDMMEEGKSPELIHTFMSKKLLENFDDDKSIKVSDYRDGLNDRIKEVKKRKRLGSKVVGTVKTGIHKLDLEIGGIDPGELFILAAGTGKGKSIFLTQMATYNLLEDRKVVYFTNEMTSKQVAYRMDANLAEIKHRKFERGNISKTQLKKLRGSITSLVKSGQLKIVEIYQGSTVLDIENVLRKHKMKPDVLIVDYAQRMTPSYSRGKGSDLNWQDVGNVVRELKNFALMRALPIASAVQLKSNAAEKDDIFLSDISLSPGVINAESDFVIGLILTERMEALGRGYLKFLKVRQGSDKDRIPFRPNYDLIRMDDASE